MLVPVAFAHFGVDNEREGSPESVGGIASMKERGVVDLMATKL